MASLSKTELRLMRNEIFARHGYIFKSADLRNHFSKQPWYNARYSNVDAMLTPIEHADYWRWSKSGDYRNRIPEGLVAFFEQNGFIWGGRWSHFDTMHFEYRPELLP